MHNSTHFCLDGIRASAGCVCVVTLLALTVVRRAQSYLDPSRELGCFGAWRTPPPPFENAAVLISGAGTGLGRATAERLAKAGWLVYAGVIDAAEAESFRSVENIEAIVMDVCSKKSVEAAVDRIRKASQSRLIAVVNNANIMSAPGPLEFVDVDAGVSKSFDVGVHGTLRVVQAALPLMRASTSDPRILIVSSGAGAIVIPFHGVYSCNKFALEACGDALRRELTNVNVVLIQPSMISTDTARAWPQQLAARWPKGRVEENYLHIRKGIERQHDALISSGLTADGCARGICHALAAQDPAPRYRVGPDALGAVLVALLPTRFADWCISMMVKAYASTPG